MRLAPVALGGLAIPPCDTGTTDFNQKV